MVMPRLEGTGARKVILLQYGWAMGHAILVEKRSEYITEVTVCAIKKNE